MRQGWRAFVFSRLLLIAIMLFPGWALAATQAGVVLVTTGSVKAISAEGSVRDLARRAPFYAGDRLVTAAGARAQVKFTDGAIVALKPNSELLIGSYTYEPQGVQASVMSLIKGGFRTVTGAIGRSNKADYKVTTPVATIGIRGTLYDANFVPEEGLALAVWDGGISACNAGGCLDLGTGADFRYGFVSLSGKREGRNEPVSDESGSAAVEAAPSIFGEIQNDMLDEGISLFLAKENFFPLGADPVAQRQAYPYTGFASVASARSNPWGTERTIDVGYARATLDAAAGGVSDWSLQSATTLGGGFITPGVLCEGDICNNYLALGQAMPGASDAGQVVWGYWYGNDVSVGAVDGVPTDNAIINPGMFVLGTYASPAVVGTMMGTASFSLYALPMILDGTGYQATAPTFIGGSDYLTTAPSASGGMSVNLADGTASGVLSFQNTVQDNWSLLFDGAVSTQGMALVLATNAVNPGSASHFMPLNGQTGVDDLAVSGSIAAKFVGVTSVGGVVGTFDVETTDQSRAVQGVFIMERTP